MSNIVVAIINYNTRDHLQACLATILLEAPSEVIVVDNASSDGSVEMVRANYPWVTLHANKTNLGYGAAANEAIASCNAEYILLLNSDTVLKRGALQDLGNYMDVNPNAAIVGPRLVNPDGTLQNSCYPFPTPGNIILEQSPFRNMSMIRNRYLGKYPHSCNQIVPYVKGAAIMIRRSAFESVKGFDPAFFMYFEEIDLCYRLNAMGWQVHFTPTTTVMHVGKASTNQFHADMAVELFNSAIKFYRRYYDGRKLSQIIAIEKSILWLRMIRDLVGLRFTTESWKRDLLAQDFSACKRALFKNGTHRDLVVKRRSNQT